MTEGSASNVIYIGNKPFMNYVTAVVMQLTQGENEIIIKSRGKFISKAVDVSEVVKSRFLKDQAETVSIVSNSEEFKNKEGRQVKVSTLDITMKKI